MTPSPSGAATTNVGEAQGAPDQHRRRRPGLPPVQTADMGVGPENTSELVTNTDVREKRASDLVTNASVQTTNTRVQVENAEALAPNPPPPP